MKKNVQISFLSLTVLAGIYMLHSSFRLDFVSLIQAKSIFFFFFLAFAILTQKKKETLFIKVIALFLIGNTFSLVFNYTNKEHEIWVLLANTIYILGLIVIFIRIIKDTAVNLVVNKFIWLILLIIIIDAYLIYEIVAVMTRFHIDFGHAYLSFSYSILKLILVSTGIIYYLANAQKERRASFLVLAVTCLFFQELAENTQFLFFTMDPLSSLATLETGLLIIGLSFFYMYCTMDQVYIVEDALDLDDDNLS